MAFKAVKSKPYYLYHKIYIGKALHFSKKNDKRELNTKRTAEQESRVEPTAETWGNRAVMRDSYQRHPATHVGVHSNPHPCTMSATEKPHCTHRYTGQEGQTCRRTHKHKYQVPLTSICMYHTCTCLHASVCTCTHIFVLVHIEHV